MKTQDGELLEKVCLRPITPADDAAMAEIVRVNLRHFGLDIPGTAYFDPELDTLSRFYAQRPGKRAYFVVVDSTQKVLGGAGMAEFEDIADCAELQKIYLCDEAKGLGLGMRLVRQIEQCAREAGYRRLYLETHTTLQAACGLYEKMGFSRVEPPVAARHGTMNRFYLKGLSRG